MSQSQKSNDFAAECDPEGVRPGHWAAPLSQGQRGDSGGDRVLQQAQGYQQGSTLTEL